MSDACVGAVVAADEERLSAAKISPGAVRFFLQVEDVLRFLQLDEVLRSLLR